MSAMTMDPPLHQDSSVSESNPQSEYETSQGQQMDSGNGVHNSMSIYAQAQKDIPTSLNDVDSSKMMHMSYHRPPDMNSFQRHSLPSGESVPPAHHDFNAHGQSTQSGYPMMNSNYDPTNPQHMYSGMSKHQYGVPSGVMPHGQTMGQAPRYPGNVYPPQTSLNQQSVPTPTLNQLLTQTPQPKYPAQSYQDYKPPANPQGSYENWGAGPAQSRTPGYPQHMGQARPSNMTGGTNQSLPLTMVSTQGMGGAQGGMYDNRTGMPPSQMPPNYRAPSPQYGLPPGGQPPYRRPPGAPGQGYSAMGELQGNEMSEMMQGQQAATPGMQHLGLQQPRARQSPMPGSGMMGPPRPPGQHQGDIMPPPSPQGYPQGMQLPQYVGSQFRGPPGPGLAASPNSYHQNQTGPPGAMMMNRLSSQNAFPANTNQSMQPLPPAPINGPSNSHKNMPGPLMSAPKTMSPSSSPQIRGVSPATQKPSSGAPSSGAHRSLPPSPAPAQLSPKPGHSPLPESRPEGLSPRVENPQPTVSLPATGINFLPSNQMLSNQYPTPHISSGTGAPPYSVPGAAPLGGAGPGTGVGSPMSWLSQDSLPGNDSSRLSPAPFTKASHGIMSPLPAAQSPSVIGESRRPPSRKSSVAPSPSGGSQNNEEASHSPSWPAAPPNNVNVVTAAPNKKASASSTPGTNLSMGEILCKQLEFGEEPERRPFLDHLFMYYQETNQLLTSIPLMGKNPLDLWKCYYSVKERLGFQQVCKKKQWKQVGNLLMAGASTNAAFTLKKAYIKYLLPYECRFEKGGVDPQTILAAVDSKKEKNRAAPSPAGSNSNSQEASSFMRPPGYHDYPPQPQMGVQPGHHMVHPSGMGNHGNHMYQGQEQMTHHQASQQYMGYASGLSNGMPAPQSHITAPGLMGNMDPAYNCSNDVNESYGQQQQQQVNPGQYPQPHSGSAPYAQRPPYYAPRMPSQRPDARSPYHPPQGPPQNQGQLQPGHRMTMPGTAQSSHSQPPQAGYPPMYRDPNSFPTSQSQPNGQPMNNSYPPPPNADVRLGGMYSQSMNNPAPAQMASMSPQPPHLSQMAQTPMRYMPRPGFTTAAPGNPRSALGNLLSAAPNSDSQSKGSPNSTWTQKGNRPVAPPGYPQTAGDSRRYSQASQYAGGRSSMIKKEVPFPPGSVEAKQPNGLRRKMIYGKDIGKIDPWHLVMCLRSGLLCESVWALDVLTVLLHDDNTVLYFALASMPGLLDSIITHYKKALSNMFEELSDLDCSDEAEENCCKTVPESHHHMIDPLDKQQYLTETNYSWVTRNNIEVIVDEADNPEHRSPELDWIFTRTNTKGILALTFEGGDGTTFCRRQFLGKHMAEHIAHDKKSVLSESKQHASLVEDLQSAANEKSACTSLPKITQKTSDKLICNGFIWHARDKVTKSAGERSLHGELKSKVNCINQEVHESQRSSDEDARKTNSRCKTEVEDGESASSTVDLAAIEAKLSHARKRRFSETIDDEPIIRDEPALECSVDNRQEEIAARCVTIANILRGLSFIPTNEKVLAASNDLLVIFGRLLNLRLKVDARRDGRAWWWDTVDALREHTLVTLSNLGGHVELIGLGDEIVFPLLDGILYWSTTSAAYARDPLQLAPHLTAQHLVMEILCKLCAHPENMDLLLATPPWERITSLFQQLAKHLNDQDPVHTEFAVVVISCLTAADPNAAYGLAIQPACVSQLLSLLESAESAAMTIAHQRGISALRDNPDAMGTTLDMIRRTSATLVDMAQVPENHSILLKQHDRILNLVMSQILDQHVAKMLADVLFECSRSSTDIQVSLSTAEKTVSQEVPESHCPHIHKQESTSKDTQDDPVSSEDCEKHYTVRNAMIKLEPQHVPVAS